MGYWLMKSEPEAFSINDLAARPNKTEHWDGVRNYQARNMLRDKIKKGDQIFFYHSNCEPPGIVGIAKVIKEGYPDFTAFDPNSKHFDPKSNSENPRWFMVDIKLIKKFNKIIPLTLLKTISELKNMTLLRKGNRLSVMPVSTKEWQTILKLTKKNNGLL
ncbi:MAG: EVE domain-containing protein [Gammaproteobacteria bacterium RIFCSPHIGHO2_12_FULL_35_23]|nr:MAG: EVE domain-containing protein [Gammaproteobacteria bacterium RIFCSPHIGHO2_12_FULL_35_23]